MNHYFITGTSAGIGKALAELILKNPSNYVVGIARRETISHENYKHIPADFLTEKGLEAVHFPDLPKAKKITLINNAGMLGEILRIGKRNASSISDEITVNLIAPVRLMNAFSAKYQDQAVEKSILNVSSGAARHAIDAWGTYCASKAGLDMYSLVFQKEQELVEPKKRITIFSVAPGVVETNMQEIIREVSPSEFSGLQKFIDLKNNNELYTVEEAAKNLYQILENPTQFSDPIIDVRDLS